MRLLLLTLLCCVWFGADASAHTRSQSQSRWVVEGNTLVAAVDADAIDVTRLYALGGDAPLAETMAAEARDAFTVHAAGSACTRAGNPDARLIENGRVTVSLRFDCPAGALARGPIEIESRLFLRVAPSHLHFVSLSDAEGRTAEAVLTDAHPSAELVPSAAPETQSFFATVMRFLPVGAEHVWTGLDHVAFILALLLLTAGDLRRIVLAATGFTLGHTTTLGLAALGVVQPNGPAIEAMIGFTIAFVALAVGVEGGERLRNWSAPLAALLVAGGVYALFGQSAMPAMIWFGLAAFVFAYPRGFPREAAWLAAVFGLIHGCGFAGALTALDLPRPRLLASLLGFNLGVEFGQIVVIVGALVVGIAARRAPVTFQRQGVALAGAALFALGTYWFASRL